MAVLGFFWAVSTTTTLNREMEILFIRHGEPAWSVDGLSQPDPDLTDRGRIQAELLADRLAAEGTPVTELIVTPAARSIQTGEPIAKALGRSGSS